MNTKLKTSLLALMAMGTVTPVMAQEGVPLLRPEERKVLREQADDFNRVLAPVMEQAAKSTVRVWDKRQRKAGNFLAYGTVVGDGKQVLSKWSELRDAQSLMLESADGEGLSARMVAVHADQDLAILEFDGDALTPAKFAKEIPGIGSFMAAPQPSGQLAGFGVLSVRERSLRDADKAFLGVISDLRFEGPGVQVREVSEGSGADQAGIQVGDVILKVEQRDISGLMELRNALFNIEPGSTVTLLVKRDDKTEEVDVLLGSRPELPNIQGARLRQMEQMGTEISSVRDSFANAIQTDMSLQPNQVGGPVVNLKGEVIGVSLARADRTRSFVMSAPAVEQLLATDGEVPEVALAELQAKIREAQARAQAQARRPMRNMRQGGNQASPEQLERHLGEMRKLMRLMEEEMGALEGR